MLLDVYLVDGVEIRRLLFVLFWSYCPRIPEPHLVQYCRRTIVVGTIGSRGIAVLSQVTETHGDSTQLVSKNQDCSESLHQNRTVTAHSYLKSSTGL